MNFFKLQATGNDFIFHISNSSESPEIDRVRQLCARRTGIGADGWIQAWKDSKSWHWSYFNSDGSPGAFCGNGALCMALYLDQIAQEKELSWKIQNKTITATREQNGRYKIILPAEELRTEELPECLVNELSELNDRGLSLMEYVMAGVPHIVLANHDSWEIQDRFAYSLDLAKHPSLPHGANITWYSEATKSAVTFERGVYEETLGCGSGALAIYIASKGTAKEFQFPGGILKVEKIGKDLSLEGLPKLVFEAIIR